MTYSRRTSKRRQVTFRIGPHAHERLQAVADLFNLRPSAYVKALLYKDLGIFHEPIDRRRGRKVRAGNRPLPDVIREKVISCCQTLMTRTLP